MRADTNGATRTFADRAPRRAKSARTLPGCLLHAGSHPIDGAAYGLTDRIQAINNTIPAHFRPSAGALSRQPLYTLQGLREHLSNPTQSIALAEAPTSREVTCRLTSAPVRP